MPNRSKSRFLRPRILVVLVLIAVLLLSGAALAMSWWIVHSAEHHVYEDAEALPDRFVAIVPGARVHPGGQPSAALEDRLATALFLYRAGKVKKILVSGDHSAPEYDEVNAMRKWLRDNDVPDRDVFLDHAGVRTLDTMERAARVFEVRDAVVCTQRYHLPRAVFLAREAGIDAVGLVADRREYPRATRDAVREMAARTRAFLDRYVFRTSPRHLGEPIPIDGDSRKTHDRFSR